MSILKTFIFFALFLVCGQAAMKTSGKDLRRANIQLNDLTPRISGGILAQANHLARYMVSIRTARPTAFFGDNHFCAGTIIASKLIVTAAHCIVDSNKAITRARRLSVIAGTPNRLKQTMSTVILTVQAVIPHPKFKRKGRNDIALLLLKTSVPFDNDIIKIIPLIYRPPTVGTNCTAVGWGQLFHKGPFASDALCIKLSITEDEYCKEKYPDNYDVGMFCAADKRNWAKDTCRGDSGGPLICGEKLSGIISWGVRCGRPGYPTVFTDISYFRSWIQGVNEGSGLRASIQFTIFTAFLAIGFS